MFAERHSEQAMERWLACQSVVEREAQLVEALPSSAEMWKEELAEVSRAKAPLLIARLVQELQPQW